MRRTSLAAFALTLAVGCGEAATPTDAGTVPDSPPGDDSGPSVDTGPRPDTGPIVRRDAGYADAGTAAPFTGEMETWQAVTIDGARCGNGSPLMVGVNLTNRSTDVVVYFQGGGACWDAITCFQFGTATHVSATLVAGDIEYEAVNGTSFLFERNDGNPYRDASYVYIPYCTGDAHSGANVASFEYMGSTREMHFEGAHNAELVLARAAATWTSTTHVTLIGASAGGFGVLANWWRAQRMFGGARVDALSDSGLPIDVPRSRWDLLRSAWGIELPEECATCDSLGDALPYYATTMTPPHRFGLLAYLNDTVIPSFYNASQTQIRNSLIAVRPSISATANQRSFFVDDSGHVLVTTPDLTAGPTGPSVRQWITQFATDDPAWGDVGP